MRIVILVDDDSIFPLLSCDVLNYTVKCVRYQGEGDGFPLGAMLALLAAGLACLGWIGHRMRAQSKA